MIGTGSDGESEICTFAELGPCPDTGPPDLTSGAYPCVGGNWGGRGVFWQGCESKEPLLEDALERRNRVFSKSGPLTPEGEAAAREVAMAVTTLHLLDCDESVDAVLNR